MKWPPFCRWHFQTHFRFETACIFIQISLQFVPICSIENNPTLHVASLGTGDLIKALIWNLFTTLHWRHNGRHSVSNHQPHHCLLDRLFKHNSKKTSKLRVTGLCAGNSPLTGDFPAQMASTAENVSIWWRHHEYIWHTTLQKTSTIQWHAVRW